MSTEATTPNVPDSDISKELKNLSETQRNILLELSRILQTSKQIEEKSEKLLEMVRYEALSNPDPKYRAALMKALESLSGLLGALGMTSEKH